MIAADPRTDPRVVAAAAALPHAAVFVTISGAHLYGFASADSDVDVRACHVLPVREVAGLRDPVETITETRVVDGLEIDLVSHDLRKFARMMLRKNGYVLEQITSPLVVRTSPWHDELRALVPGCVTKHHVHHYLGFAATEAKLFAKETPPRVKPLLYVYRVLLTGIRLMRCGEVEANLSRLNEEFRLPHVAELIARKTSGSEESRVRGDDLPFHEAEFDRLGAMLEAAGAATHLPDEPPSRAALHDLLLRLRSR